jgi:serine/threonine protein kinase
LEFYGIAMMLAPGVRLGPYEIVSVLGAGGMGTGVSARDTRLDRLVALKLLPEEFRERADRQQRFQSEARLISALNHPHICALFDVGEQDARRFSSWSAWRARRWKIGSREVHCPVARLRATRRRLQTALDHAHQAQITHRDLKPSNVMITATGVKLLDFGLARGPVIEATSGASTESLVSPGRLTGEGTLVGTFPVHGAGNSSKAGRPIAALTSLPVARCCSRWRPGGRRLLVRARQA